MTNGQSVLAQQRMPVRPSSPPFTSAIHVLTSSGHTLANGVPIIDRYGSSRKVMAVEHFLRSSRSCHLAMRFRHLRMISAYASS